MYKSSIGAKGNNGAAAQKLFLKRLSLIILMALSLVLCIYLLNARTEEQEHVRSNGRQQYLNTMNQIDHIKEHMVDRVHLGEVGGLNRHENGIMIERIQRGIVGGHKRNEIGEGHSRGFGEHRPPRGNEKHGYQEEFQHGQGDYEGKHRRKQQTSNKDKVIESIVKGRLHLIDVNVSPESLSVRKGIGFNTSYTDVDGIFCELDWSIHKSDPSSTSMFRDLVMKSGCKRNKETVNLETVIKAVREYDSTAEGKLQINAMKPTGFVFHESRCGSTLVANSLAAFSPETNRVYSESAPPINVLKACPMSRNCIVEKQIKLFQDVLYLMGRTNDPDEKYLFFKFQSATTLHIDLANKAFPTTPWLFVYRDPIEVMMSHVGSGTSGAAVCLRSRRFPPQETLNLISHSGSSLYSLSDDEYCAAYLVSLFYICFSFYALLTCVVIPIFSVLFSVFPIKATLCESAYNQHVESKSGHMVEYSTLPDSLMDIIPEYFLDGPSSFSERERENILLVSQNYSKGRGNQAGEWHEDSSTKRKNASPSIKEAAEKFLNPVYLSLKSS